MEEKVNYEDEIIKADSVIKALVAIMNEEEDIDAYMDKTPEEMQDIFNLLVARYPDNIVASYDPKYTMFGQVCLNGYHTFGIDFLKVLLKRVDSIPNICIKGLIDIIENLMIENQQLVLETLPEEERIKIMKNLANEEELTDEEFKNKLNKEEV